MVLSRLLRHYLRGSCLPRHYDYTRSLSIKTVTESNNSHLVKHKEDQDQTQDSHLQEQKKVTFESLVSNVKSNFKAFDAVNLLHTLRKHSLKGDIDPKTFLSDDRFIEICRTFERGCQVVKISQLVLGLRCCLEMGLPPELELMRIIENEVLWKSRKMTFKNLCSCFSFHTQFQQTEQQKQIVKTLASYISNRWIEIENAVDVIVILDNKDYFSEDLLCKVEDKILEFGNKVQADDLVSLFMAFARNKRRPSPVLRALSYYIIQKQEALGLRQGVDLCFAMSSLRFIDTNLLNKITVDALSALESNKNAHLMSSLLTALGLLKWDHSLLLDSCCDWVEKNSDKWAKRDWVSLVLSLAHLNYQPENGEALFSLALKSFKLSDSKNSSLPPGVWFDVVWALATLGKATPQILMSALEPDFYQPLVGPDVGKSVINKLKLLNIYAVARIEFPLAKFPSLPLQQPETPISAVDKKLEQTVVDALNTFLPSTYLATNLNTNLGFDITAEFIVDQGGKPVPIVDYGIKGGMEKELKPLPQNFKRIALMVWGFKDMTTKTSGISGMNALSVRLLTKLKYHVVEVPYMEYQNLKTTVQQVMYLQQKIKEKVEKQ